jgi:hypothetical protein
MIKSPLAKVDPAVVKVVNPAVPEQLSLIIVGAVALE